MLNLTSFLDVQIAQHHSILRDKIKKVNIDSLYIIILVIVHKSPSGAVALHCTEDFCLSFSVFFKVMIPDLTGTTLSSMLQTNRF